MRDLSTRCAEETMREERIREERMREDMMREERRGAQESSNIPLLFSRLTLSSLILLFSSCNSCCVNASVSRLDAKPVENPRRDAGGQLGVEQKRRLPSNLAVDETVILMHPPPP